MYGIKFKELYIVKREIYSTVPIWNNSRDEYPLYILKTYDDALNKIKEFAINFDLPLDLFTIYEISEEDTFNAIKGYN